MAERPAPKLRTITITTPTPTSNTEAHQDPHQHHHEDLLIHYEVLPWVELCLQGGLCGGRSTAAAWITH